MTPRSPIATTGRPRCARHAGGKVCLVRQQNVEGGGVGPPISIAVTNPGNGQRHRTEVFRPRQREAGPTRQDHVVAEEVTVPETARLEVREFGKFGCQVLGRAVRRCVGSIRQNGDGGAASPMEPLICPEETDPGQPCEYDSRSGSAAPGSCDGASGGGAPNSRA